MLSGEMLELGFGGRTFSRSWLSDGLADEVSFANYLAAIASPPRFRRSMDILPLEGSRRVN